jgi:cell division protein FtsW
VVVAWLLAEGKRQASLGPGPGPWWQRLRRQATWPGVAIGLFLLIALLLKSQPDIGMLLVLGAVFLGQFFVSGMNLLLVGAGAGTGVAAGIGAYFAMPHFRSRIDRFWSPETAAPGSGTTHQIDTAMRAFGNGGLFGRGPGEGFMKASLPDAHADMVYAVAGEEFGFVVCLLILLLFAFVVVRGLVRLLAEADLFVLLAAAGLLTQFGLQSFINMASTLALIPTKGMTLPFVSYGGSSVFAIALGMGMLLALTRRRNGRLDGLR